MNFRQGRHTQKNKHMIIRVGDIKNKDEAKKWVNKTVTWTTKTGKIIKGKIANSHGNKGSLRVIFERGLPGQSIGTKVKVE